MEGSGAGQGLKVEKESFTCFYFILFYFILELNVRTVEKIKLKIDVITAHENGLSTASPYEEHFFFLPFPSAPMLGPWKITGGGETNK